MAELAGLEQILALIARRVSVIHGSTDAAGYGGGGDVDCVVDGLDDLWPLRLQAPARFVNRLRYDVTATSWFVASGDEGVSIDTLEDHEGIGKYGFSTLGMTGGRLVAPGPAAAYLAIKRLKKKNLEPASWDQVGALALQETAAFRSKLVASLPRTGERLSEVVLGGSAPSEELARQALRDLGSNRLKHPLRLARYARHQSTRVSQRLLRPTGLYVVLVGPDGAGKSTIAAALAEDHFGFRRARRLHWRPGLLPGSSVSSSAERDTTRPHEMEARSRARSIAVALYHWTDFLLGTLVTILPATRRSTLIVAERPWWDLGIDPLRYRLDVPPGFVKSLGRYLKQPDLVLNLEAPATTLVTRKAEITEEATEEQLVSWRAVAPQLGRTRSLDASGGIEKTITDAQDAVRDVAADQALKNLGAGWAAAPNRRSPRWWLPRGPRTVARAAFDAWSPMTPSGSRGWAAAGLLARSGGMRALRRVAPPRQVIERVAPHLVRGENVAIHRTNHVGRFIVLFVSPEGVRRFAKVVTDDNAEPLDREALALQELAPHLPPPLRAPELVGRSDGVLVLEAVRRRPGWNLQLEADVARALGGFAAGRRTHGDFAPWNLIPTDGDWVLVDWEAARSEGDPFEDPLHYIVQSHVLLGTPSEGELLAGVLEGQGWIGTALRAYSESSEHNLGDIRSAMRRYLEKSSAQLDRSAPRALDAMAARDRLGRALAQR